MELQAFTPEAKKLADFVKSELAGTSAATRASGSSPISEFGSKRLHPCGGAVRSQPRPEVGDVVHKGNIMKFTEGAFRSWGYDLVRERVQRRRRRLGRLRRQPGRQDPRAKDAIADITLQQVLIMEWFFERAAGEAHPTRPELGLYSAYATLALGSALALFLYNLLTP